MPSFRQSARRPSHLALDAHSSGTRDLDGHALMGIALTAGPDAGPFAFRIDDARAR